MDNLQEKMPYLIGEKLPEGEYSVFQGNDIKKVNLKSYLGKWLVLFFYPGDFTFICPTELSELADLYGQFVKEGAEVISVSTDSAFVHKAWHDSSPSIKKITYPMLADPTGSLSRSLGIYLPKDGQALRGSFIINPEGEVIAYEVHHNDIGRNPSELLRKLQAAKFVREHGGEVCPVNWKPGDKTLTPSTDLVGKL